MGIEGTTGAGKSTLISLLTRLYDPTEGRILLDGVDLRDYRREDLRRQFAVVLQESVLFSASIAENIAYAVPGASRAQIVSACEVPSHLDPNNQQRFRRGAYFFCFLISSNFLRLASFNSG